MPAPRKTSSVITLRAKATIALPPMTLGYSNLIDPETFDPDKPKLTMNGHLTPQGIDALKEDIAKDVYTKENIEKLVEECRENKIAVDNLEPLDPEAWLADKLKEPKEGFPIQLPYIKLANNLYYYKWQDGEKTQMTRTINAWDGNNRKLNLKRLLLGRGSVVEPIVFGNLYYSKLGKVIAPSLKLVGIRVLELVQFQKGGSNAPTETSQEDIANVMGRELHAADLSAYMGEDEPEEDDEGDHPVKPADRLGKMF